MRLFVVTNASSVAFGALIEIFDFGTRKSRAVVSALLYSAAMVSALFSSQPDVLFVGRAVFGLASALHHSSFEAYVVQEHGSLGFPEEWLSQTFAATTHLMSLLAFLAGLLGQTTAAAGDAPAVIVVCAAVFLAAAVYISGSWTADISSSRFLFGAFVSNLSQTLGASRRNRFLAYFLAVSALAETALTVFSYFWAQLLSSVVSDERARLPFALIFSAYVCASMVGAYSHGMLVSRVGSDSSFQAVLSGLVAAFSLAGMVQTPIVIFVSSVFVYGLIGAYWPCIGTLRAKAVGAEQRAASQFISRVSSTALTALILIYLHHSATLTLIACAGCLAAATLAQSMAMQQVGGLFNTIFDSFAGSDWERIRPTEKGNHRTRRVELFC